jgi:hypothetical protein
LKILSVTEECDDDDGLFSYHQLKPQKRHKINRKLAARCHVYGRISSLFGKS